MFSIPFRFRASTLHSSGLSLRPHCAVPHSRCLRARRRAPCIYSVKFHLSDTALITTSPRRSVAGKTSSPLFSFAFTIFLCSRFVEVFVLVVSSHAYKKPRLWPRHCRQTSGNRGPLSLLSALRALSRLARSVTDPSVPPLRDPCVPSLSRFRLCLPLPPSSRRDRR